MTEKHPLSTLDTPRIILVDGAEKIQGLDEEDIVVATTKRHDNMPRALLLKRGGKFCFGDIEDNKIKNITSCDTTWCSEALHLFCEFIEKKKTHNRLSFSREYARALSPEILGTPLSTDNQIVAHLKMLNPACIPVAITVFKGSSGVYIFFANTLGNKKFNHSIAYCDILPTPTSDREKFPLRVVKNETMITTNSHDEVALQSFTNYCFKDEKFLSMFIVENAHP